MYYNVFLFTLSSLFPVITQCAARRALDRLSKDIYDNLKCYVFSMKIISIRNNISVIAKVYIIIAFLDVI